MATKVSYEIEIKTLGGTELSVTGDAAAAVYSALGQKSDLIIRDSQNNTVTIVPFHAVDSAVVSITSATVDDPQDANCNEGEETAAPETPGN